MSAAAPAAAADDARRRARRRAQLITLALLATWFVVSFVVPVLFREADLRLFGWPVAYWMSAQGSLLVYLAITVAYAFTMNRLDRRYPQDGEGDGG